MTSSPSRHDCRGCCGAHAVTEDLVTRLLSAPTLNAPAVVVPDAVYSARLEACARCPSLQPDRFTCGVCGCIVRVMAKYRDRACRRPGDPRWDRYPRPATT
ncbi:hypothetical protein Deipe_0767 [Deinococcus peraridilitoris DSM 19664]|uniref:Uncharacterized protein n=1 Tax=Deinococcus peraridilitoris (strain DSM 19664 / LMG 22246 / CIP 109416 / KR-200) TaxID=937777 RepID=K9ZYR7_DEIPD|nr:hypothetical protein Deipe_0767 [Deinococcus peraridilitoris DSM 19664]